MSRNDLAELKISEVGRHCAECGVMTTFSVRYNPCADNVSDEPFEPKCSSHLRLWLELMDEVEYQRIVTED